MIIIDIFGDYWTCQNNQNRNQYIHTEIMKNFVISLQYFFFEIYLNYKTMNKFQAYRIMVLNSVKYKYSNKRRHMHIKHIHGVNLNMNFFLENESVIVNGN